MSESQGNNTLNQASSNMPNLGAAPNANPGVGQAASGASMPQMASSTQPSPQSMAQPQQSTVAQPQSNPVAAQPVQAVPTAPAQNPASATQPAAKQPVDTAPTQAAQPQPRPTGRQVDYFAEQNARSAEKKTKNAKSVRLVVIIGAIIAVLAIAGIVVWAMMRDDQVSDLTLDDINNLRFTFADIYDETKNLDDVRNRYNKILNTELGREYADQVKLQLMFFYMNNGFAARTVEVGETVDVAKLGNEAQSAYYNQMYNAYLNTGDSDKAAEAQFESAVLIGDRFDGSSDSDDGTSNGGDNNDGGNSGSGGDGSSQGEQPSEQQYTCDGVEFFSFPVACAVDGKEPYEP